MTADKERRIYGNSGSLRAKQSAYEATAKIRAAQAVMLAFPAIFLVMLWLNFLTPMFADDFSYCFSMVDGERVDSLGEVFSSMHLHRQQINGRYFSHVFAMLFLMLPKLIFNIVNSAVTVLICFIIYRFILLFCESKRKASFLFAVAVMMLWVFTPAFGEVYLWLDGSCNYSWAICSGLIFLSPFVLRYCRAESRPALPVSVLLTIQAFVAGAYSESGSLSSVFIAFCLLLLITIRDKKLPLQLVCSFLSACAGLLFLVLSPSMLADKRGSLSLKALLGLFGSVGEALQSLFKTLGAGLVAGAFAALVGAGILLFLLRRRRKIFFSLLWLGLCIVSARFMAYAINEAPPVYGPEMAFKTYISDAQITVVAVCFIFLSLYLLALYHKVELRILVLSAVFFLGGLCSLAIFVFALYIPARGCCYYMTYLTVATVWLLSGLIDKGSKRAACALSALTLVLFGLTFCYGISDIIHVNIQSQDRLLAVQAAKEEGLSELVFEAYDSDTKYSVSGAFPDTQPDPDSWPNPDIAAYYGLEKISTQ